MTREEIITFLIRRSHPNLRHVRLVNRSLFENDHRQEINNIVALLDEIERRKK